MPIEYQDFLNYWGFEGDPFESTAAEQEVGKIQRYFVRPASFNLLVGDPREPRSCVIFAGPGVGKSSNRLEVARVAAGHPIAPALVVVIDELDYVNLTGEPTIDELSGIIARLTLMQLDAVLRPREAVLDQLRTTNQRSYDQLYLHWKHYANEGCYGRPLPSDEAHYLHHAVIHPGSARARLRGISQLVRALAFGSVYVLFDSLEEGLTPTELLRLARLLQPLLDNPSLLDSCGFAFKFFLPATLAPVLQEHSIGRFDKLVTYTLTHTDKDLCQILSRRLIAHSRIGPSSDESSVTSFGSLCEGIRSDDDLSLDLALARATPGSPRQLLRLVGCIAKQHCQAAQHLKEPIPLALIANIVQDITNLPFEYTPSTTHADTSAPDQPPQHPTRDSPGQTDASVASRPQPPQANRVIPLLIFHADGRVQIGESIVTTLEGKLFKLMHLLWDRRGTLVLYDDLESSLYGNDPFVREDPKSSREKLVRRLRIKIEPTNPQAGKSRTYITINEGNGYKLCNYQDAL